MKKRNIVIIAAAGALALSAGALALLWKPEPKGIVVGTASLPDSLNPVLVQNAAGMNAAELVFDGLVNFEVDAGSGAVSSELALAESIEQDPRDKKTYRVKLRDASWHDGTPLTAADVEFSFKAYVSPDNHSPKREYLSSFIEKVRAVDSSEVEIVFRRPIPPFRVYPVLSFKIIPSRYRGEFLSEALRYELLAQGKFRIVEREKLDAIMREIELQAAGLASEDQAVRIGEAAAAKQIVIGSAAALTVKRLPERSSRVAKFSP